MAYIPYWSNLLLANAAPLGGPGVIVEVDKAKFGKMKYNRGSYRAGMWFLGSVDRPINQCFFIPCPIDQRSAAVFYP